MTARRSLVLKLPSDPAERRLAWAGAFAPFLDMTPSEAEPAPGLLALTRHRLGPLTLVDLLGPAQTLRRTPEMAAGQGLDGLLVLFCLDGEGRAACPGGTAAFGRLQGVLLDLARPATLVAGPMRATALVLPRALVPDPVPSLAALHGALLDPASDPVSRLFFTCIQELVETAGALGDDQIPQITRAVATLCATVCAAALRRRARTPAAPDRHVSPPSALAAPLSAASATRPAAVTPAAEAASDEARRGVAIRRFIRAELASPSLSVETVAERFGLSRAGLYRLFSDEGGVQRFIREQRLARAMAMLAQPRGAGRPRVSTIAYECGFSDEKTFSRAFKRRFGLLPSAVRSTVPPRDEADFAPTLRLEEIAA